MGAGLWPWVAQPHCFPTEIPLFHVLNARITFSNLCGCDEPLNSVWVPTSSSGSGGTTSGTPQDRGGPCCSPALGPGAECSSFPA